MKEKQLRADALMGPALAGARFLHRPAPKQSAAIELSPALVTLSGIVASTGFVARGGLR